MTHPTQDNFALVLLRPCDPDGPGLAHLSWRLHRPDDRVVQVYVNGSLFDAATDPMQREMWLHLDRATDVRIELLLTPAGDAWVNHAARLSGWSPGFVTEAALAMVRDESLPADSRVMVMVDGQSDSGHRLWTQRDGRGGFGGLFGIGSFGTDDAAGAGAGMGQFGLGPFGMDGDAWRWRRDDLPAGEHVLEVRVIDGAGRVEAQLPQPVTITLDALPQPAKHLTIDDEWTLHWQA